MKLLPHIIADGMSLVTALEGGGGIVLKQKGPLDELLGTIISLKSSKLAGMLLHNLHPSFDLKTV